MQNAKGRMNFCTLHFAFCLLTSLLWAGPGPESGTWNLESTVQIQDSSFKIPDSSSPIPDSASDSSFETAQPVTYKSCLKGYDTPNDGGGGINLEWAVAPLDSGSIDRFGGYRVFRAGRREGPYDSVGYVRPSGPQDSAFSVTASFGDSTIDGHPYYYYIKAFGPKGVQVSDTIGPVESSAQWFHFGRLNFLILTIIISAAIIIYIERAKKMKLFVRRIAGLDAIEDAVGRATEMGRPILFSPGLGPLNDVTTLAALSIFGRVARKAAEYATPLLMPNNDPMVLTAARETAKQAYNEMGRPDLYNENNISFLTSDQFGYAAGVDGLVMREKPGAVFWQGYFYAEALILAETGHAVGAIQIAGTTSIEQLPFFVVACDYTLLGEEMFAASAYLDPEPQMMGSLKGEDFLKAVIVILVLVMTVFGTVGVIISTARGPSGMSQVFDKIVNWFTQI
jgi:hypothetical protein